MRIRWRDLGGGGEIRLGAPHIVLEQIEFAAGVQRESVRGIKLEGAIEIGKREVVLLIFEMGDAAVVDVFR